MIVQEGGEAKLLDLIKIARANITQDQMDEDQWWEGYADALDDLVKDSLALTAPAQPAASETTVKKSLTVQSADARELADKLTVALSDWQLDVIEIGFTTDEDRRDRLAAIIEAAIDRHDAALRAQLAETEKLAYIGEHHFPDLTWKARFAECAEQVTSIKQAVVDTVGGTVEGRPTNALNYLQRLRELVAKENAKLAVPDGDELLHALGDVLLDEWGVMFSSSYMTRDDLAEAWTQALAALDGEKGK